MLKVMYGQALFGGVLRASFLSSLARWGIFLRGAERRCLEGRGPVRQGRVWNFLAWRCRVLSGRVQHGEVLHGNLKHGFISVLRGLMWLGFVRSCPVRQRKVKLGHVLFGSAGLCKVVSRHGFVRSGIDAWGTAERGFVLYGKVLSWFGEVLIGAVGFIGARYCIARRAEALFWQGGVAQSEVLSGVVCHAEVLFRRGTVGFGFARLRAVGQAVASSRLGVVEQTAVRRGAVRCSTARRSQVRRYLGFAWSGEVGRCIARRALALLWRGQVWLGTVLSGNVWFSSVFFGRVLLGFVRWCPVRQGSVKCGLVSSGHGYGGYQK